MATYTTGGNLPPLEKVYTTGGNLPATPVQTTAAPPTGGPLPATPVPGTGTAPRPDTPPTSIQSAAGTVQGALDTLLNNNGAYMRNARQTGLDMARSRGLINSSIAAGNSQAAAISAAQPLVNNALDIFNRRENENFTLGRDSSLANLQNWLAGRNQERNLETLARQHGYDLENMTVDQRHRLELANNNAKLQDWMSNQDFTRQFNGALSMLPITNSFQLNNMIAQLAITDPEAYPPNVVSGITNFLNQNMFSILKQYFPNLVVAGTNTGGT